MIDGGHNPRVSRIELSKVARKFDYDILYIWVQTDEKTTRARSLKRNPNNEMDYYNRALTIEEFDRQYRKFTEPNNIEHFVVISGRHTYATQARIVLKRLANNHEVPRKEPPQRIPQPPSASRRPLSIN